MHWSIIVLILAAGTAAGVSAKPGRRSFVTKIVESPFKLLELLWESLLKFYSGLIPQPVMNRINNLKDYIRRFENKGRSQAVIRQMYPAYEKYQYAPGVEGPDKKMSSSIKGRQTYPAHEVQPQQQQQQQQLYADQNAFLGYNLVPQTYPEYLQETQVIQQPRPISQIYQPTPLSAKGDILRRSKVKKDSNDEHDERD